IRDGFTRRDFVAAGAATAVAFPSAARGAKKVRKRAASDIVNVAMIGAGGMGAANGANLVKSPGVNIVALADVDFEHVARSMLGDNGQPNADREPLKAAYEKAAKYSDYRKMLDSRKDIDAVVIATPDHHHAAAAKMAMERGIHVYVQKPLTYSVHEGRVLLELAEK